MLLEKLSKCIFWHEQYALKISSAGQIVAETACPLALKEELAAIQGLVGTYTSWRKVTSVRSGSSTVSRMEEGRGRLRGSARWVSSLAEGQVDVGVGAEPYPGEEGV